MFCIVNSTDNAMDFLRWLSGQSKIALDTETTDVDIYSRDFRVRYVQFGTKDAAWVISMDRWLGVIEDAVKRYDGTYLIHNTPFDAKALQHHGIVLPWHRIDDTMIAMRLAEPDQSAGLKEAAGRHVSSGAAAPQYELAEAMEKNGWTWATVPDDFPPYLRYAAQDVVITARLSETDVCRSGFNSPVYPTEMAVLQICSGMEHNGMRIDHEYCTEQLHILRTRTETIRKEVDDRFGVSVSSPAQLGKWFVEHGARITSTTAGGAPSTDKKQLTKLVTQGNPDVRDLAMAVLDYRDADKIAGSYLEPFLTKSHDDVLHASINTLGARTGRMCIPTSHKILTHRGVLSFDQVVVGDETLDEYGNWTRVDEIFVYPNQPTTIWKTREHTLESTAEHRWLSYSERGVRYLAPIDDHRRTVHLVPEGEHADFYSTNVAAKTDAENFAALVGWLVSDGRAHEGGHGVGLRAYLYQTETKFYEQMLEVVPPEAVMYDRITINDHHEVRLKTRWLRPRLHAVGLSIDNGSTLRESSSLIEWVVQLSPSETWAFLQAIWLADGSTAHPHNKKITCDSAPLRTALQIAAYRCGYSSFVTNDGRGGWSTKDRLGVKMKRAVVNTRSMQRSESRSDVWCVRTSSGTFTAWDQGPYLTGNSIRNPALQTLPKPSADPQSRLVRNAVVPRTEDELLVSADFEQIEFRILADISDDPLLSEAFTVADSAPDNDFFIEMAKIVYDDPTLDKSDPRRKPTKNVMYGMAYGAGPAKLALTAGISEDQANTVRTSILAAFPGMNRSMARYERQAKEKGCITTAFGRQLVVEPDHAYAALNAYIQGTAGDLFKQALVRLAHAGFEDHLVVPVHDECVFSIPIEDIEEARHEIDSAMVIREHPYVPVSASKGLDRWGDA